MFPLKFIDNAEGIYDETKSKLVELSLMKLHESVGTEKERLQFKLRRRRAQKYLGELETPIDTPFDFCYIPKSSRKIIKFAAKYYSLYSQFQKGRGS